MPGLRDGLIGQRVREARLKLGLTQECLAARANLHFSYIGQVERGNKIPSLKTLNRIAKALNLRLEDLVGESDNNISSRHVLEQELLLIVKNCPETELRLYIHLIRQIKKYLKQMKID